MPSEVARRVIMEEKGDTYTQQASDAYLKRSATLPQAHGSGSFATQYAFTFLSIQSWLQRFKCYIGNRDDSYVLLRNFEFSTRFRALFLKQVLQTQNRPISTIIVFVLNALLVQTVICWGWTQSMKDNNQDMSGLFSLLLIVFWGIYVLRIASDLCWTKIFESLKNVKIQRFGSDLIKKFRILFGSSNSHIFGAKCFKIGTEKRERIREGMRMMGMSDLPYYLSFFTFEVWKNMQNFRKIH